MTTATEDSHRTPGTLPVPYLYSDSNSIALVPPTDYRLARFHADFYLTIIRPASARKQYYTAPVMSIGPAPADDAAARRFYVNKNLF